ncbi:MAG TPA: GGDEF domain-containing protein [Gaiellales bacterium]|jgi:diguanylate cyclase (GGDEF)-like protein
MPVAPERLRLRGVAAAVALAAYAATWLAPAAARPAIAALAVSAAIATGPAGAAAAALGCLAVPIPWSMRAALLVAAAVNGGLHAQRMRQSRELAARSFTDRLTGLRNYDYFAEALRSELARVRRYGGCVTLVMLDLDRFKAFNDQHGHAAGNRLLNAVGQAIAREKRDADIAARFGGEEFAVLVPGREGDGLVVAERMRHAIADLSPAPTSRRDFTPGVSASAGVATFPVDARTPQELFELADRALYEAKRRGRDQVVAVSELVEPQLRLAR